MPVPSGWRSCGERAIVLGMLIVPVGSVGVDLVCGGDVVGDERRDTPDDVDERVDGFVVVPLFR